MADDNDRKTFQGEPLTADSSGLDHLSDPDESTADRDSDSTVVLESDDLEKYRDEDDDDHQAYLIVISGPHVGRMFQLDAPETRIGRSPDVDLRIQDIGVSRKHARVIQFDDGVLVEDLGSSNGTFVNGDVVDNDYQLEDGDKITLGTTTILKFTYQDSLDESFQRQMYEASLRDGLTDAFNKEYLLNHLRSEIAYALRHSTDLSFLLFDIDDFKQLNDTHGHLAGDEVLSNLAELCRSSIRTEDVFARYGGEEFAIVSRSTSMDAARGMAERIRREIEEHAFDYDGNTFDITVSVGISTVQGSGAENPEELIDAADEALYSAKDAGKNTVRVAE
jgi:diguanylate cyclase (GGDEF)-like protein